eukprot:GEMP01058605.1.p1 GENE.GEMP01058605.1~~GEMP01058605.1.p1  ORF type:complete len:324 (+),score=46.21 GEMP01058605.1:114-1085(+)
MEPVRSTIPPALDGIARVALWTLDDACRWVLMLWGVVLLLYRIPITRCRASVRAPTLKLLRIGTGWIVTVVFARLFSSFWVASICGLVGGAFNAFSSEWFSVHAVASFLGSLFSALFLGIPYNDGIDPGSAHTFHEVFLPHWCTIIMLFFSAAIAGTLFLLIPPIAKTWEVIGIPILGSYACLVPWMHNNLFLEPYNIKCENWVWLAWVVLALMAMLSQWLCMNQQTVDLNDSSGMQNDVVRALLAGEEVSSSALFESRFPKISRVMNDQGVADTHALSKGGLNGPLLGQRGAPLTEQQIKLIEICRENPEQRDRILFGGGLY